MKTTDKGRWPSAPLADPATVKAGIWCLGIGHPHCFLVGRAPVVRLGCKLEAVLADVAQAVDADERDRVRRRPPGDARDETVRRVQALELRSRGLRHPRVLGVCDDRCEHTVDVEEEGCELGLGGKGSERVHSA